MPAVDRINGYSPADTRNNNRKIRDAGSKETGNFELPEEETGGVVYEPGSLSRPKARTMAEIREEIAREEAAAAKANLHTRFDGPGVEVELSTDGYNAASKPAEQSIASIFKDTWRSIVNFFLSIWNGGAVESAVKPDPVQDSSLQTTEDDDLIGAPEPVEEAEDQKEDGFVPFMGSGAAYDDPQPSGEALNGERMTSSSAPRGASGPRDRSNSPEEIAAFLTDYGGGRLAKNSDLLTQYDRRGRIVPVDPSDRRRILHGEGRVRRY